MRASRIYLNHMPPSWVPQEVAALEGDRFFAPPVPGLGSVAALPPWLMERDPGRPLVYATLDTVFNGARPVFERLIAAADGERFDMLLTVGRNGNPDSFEAPENVRPERYVDQERVLRVAAAVVCHGGMGTVMGALRNGVPMCCIPLGGDQPINAMRCEALGCGRSYTTYTPPDGLPLPHARPEDLDAEVLRAHIVALLEEDHYRTSVGRLAEEIRALPGVAEEAALLDELAS
jgi:MGT family glycosyltransferase